MGKPVEITVVDENNNVVGQYHSKSDCAKKYNITIYKLDELVANKTKYNGVYFMSDKLPYGYIETECSYCGKKFYCLNSRIEKSDNIYCSIECRNKSKSGDLNCKCPVCGKLFHVKIGRLQKNNATYCSRECHAIAKKELMKGDKNHQYGLKGSLNSSWKSDERITTYGYRYIRCLNHPFRNNNDFVFEHRLVAEKYLLNNENSVEIDGIKYLKKEYVVHHINFNRLDNRPENLKVMLKEEHINLHRKLENNFIEFENYCIENGIDFEETYKQYLYNIHEYGR